MRYINLRGQKPIGSGRFASTWLRSEVAERPDTVTIDGLTLTPDRRWNVSPGVLQLMHRRLLFEQDNPLNLLKRRIVQHFDQTYRKVGSGSPLFTSVEKERRAVSLWDNFNSLLTPSDHVSRRPTDTYYINSDYCLRAHTSAHQHSLISQGLDSFLVFGDVFRRDAVDRSHFPCFHQMEGVRLFSNEQLFGSPSANPDVELFENGDGERTATKQELHTEDCARVLQLNLKHVVEQLARDLFGQEAQLRWVDAYFPFTHPSFELEVLLNDDWMELVGCGLIEQKLLKSAGAGSKVGWAFGFGLERLAMKLYSIPDIRLFWSQDSGFLSQFQGMSPLDHIVYKPISQQPQVLFDFSFWLPEDAQSDEAISADVNDIVRSVGGDLVEQVKCTDRFIHPKSARHSHCYRIVYRSMTRPLTKDEVNKVHSNIRQAICEQLNVQPRI